MKHAPALAALIALAAVAGAPAAPLHPPGGGLHHGSKHPSAPDPARFFTNRATAILPLPEEQDAFTFVVLGDRTGGPAEGVEVLAEAVGDVNLIEPDLVMTVGDLVEGYNERPRWIAQMREFRGIMDGLLCPWFPVAGNHDIYWRGADPPEGEHESDYEMHFGPLWYAFEHKGCWFIALYSDEGDPATGRKTFNEPASQVMSDEQLSWLEATLDRAKDARHVFVFLHHPRWLGGGYGDDWERVHVRLAAAGNVRIVFAGHIHRMRYDGVRDGIEYVTLATVGGAQSAVVPEAGYLHQFHLVTVRRDQIAMASIPVGDVMDVRALTGDVSDETRRLAGLTPVVTPRVRVGADGAADDVVEVAIDNTASRPVEVSLVPGSDDRAWRFAPDHVHGRVPAGTTGRFAFRVERRPAPLDDAFAPPTVTRRLDYLAETMRYAIPERVVDVPLLVDLPKPATPDREQVLVLDGQGDALRVPSDLLHVPDGPLTLECWFEARSLEGRIGLVTKTETSDYGLFVSDGRPAFFLFLGDSYAEAVAPGPILEPGGWHHLAGVYDGAACRLYLDGRLVASVERSGPRRRNDLPMYVGGDVDPGGRLVSTFAGRIDAVRLSTVARYGGASFTPQRRHDVDEHTSLLLDMDGGLGRWVYDGSGRAVHPTLVGDAHLQALESGR